MNENIIRMRKSAVAVFFLTLIISVFPYISQKISPQNKMVHPPALFVYFSNQALSARELATRDTRWIPYNGKRIKNKKNYGYLWLEFPPQHSENENLLFINKEQSYYTELLKPSRLNAITLYKQGDCIPASKNPFKQSLTVFPLKLTKDSTESYIVEYHDPRGVILEPFFVDSETWFSAIRSQKMKISFITGIILSLIIYLVYLFKSTKNSIPFYFALFATSNLFVYAFETRLLLECLDTFVYPPWLFPISVALNVIAGLFFIRRVFNTYINKITRVAIHVFMILTAICGLASFFVLPLQLGSLLTIFFFSLYIFLIQPLTFAIRNKNNEVLLTILAIFPLLSIKLIDISTQTFSMGESFFTDDQIIFAITVSLILYAVFQNEIAKNSLNTISTRNKDRIPEEPNLPEISVGEILLPDSIYILKQKKDTSNRVGTILRSLGYSPSILIDRVTILEKVATKNIDLLIINSNSNINEYLSLCRLLRLQHLKRDLPILLITNVESNALLNEALTAGVNDFLKMPFSNSEFITRVKSLLRLKAIARLNTDLSHSESEKNAFLYFLTHNVNTPLTLLLNRIQELSMQNNSIEIEEIVEDLEVSAGEINDIIQNVLISFRISDNKHTLRIETFNLQDTIERMQPLLTKKAEIKKQKLQWIIPDTIPSISADRSAIKGILYNIIDNAIKFTPKYGLIRVQIKVLDSVIIEIADSGPGIKKQDIKDLFEPFVSLSNKPTGGESSTGLGLYVAKELSFMSGATLSYTEIDDTSDAYSGANFILNLPISNI